MLGSPTRRKMDCWAAGLAHVALQSHLETTRYTFHGRKGYILVFFILAYYRTPHKIKISKCRHGNRMEGKAKTTNTAYELNRYLKPIDISVGESHTYTIFIVRIVIRFFFDSVRLQIFIFILPSVSQISSSRLTIVS